MTPKQKFEYAEMCILDTGCDIIRKDESKIVFLYNYQTIFYYPFKEWATGKGIKDGRGLNNLLKQIKNV